LKGNIVVGSNVGVCSNSHVRSLGSIVGAGAISGGVGPVVLVVSTVRFIVVEGVALPTTVATEA